MRDREYTRSVHDFPSKSMQQIFACFTHKREGVIMLKKNAIGERATSIILDCSFQFLQGGVGGNEDICRHK